MAHGGRGSFFLVFWLDWGLFVFWLFFSVSLRFSSIVPYYTIRPWLSQSTQEVISFRFSMT
jgi:hypothetical protein